MIFELFVAALLLAILAVTVVNLTSKTPYRRPPVAHAPVVDEKPVETAHDEPRVSGTDDKGMPIVVPGEHVSGTVEDYFSKDPNWMHEIRFEEERMLELVDDVQEVFDQFGIDTYTANGTALGLVRDKQLIPWDHDWDMNASVHDFFVIQKQVIPELFRRGYKILEIVPLSACPFLYSERYQKTPGDAKRLLFIKDGQMFDVAFQVWMPPLETVEAYGRVFRVPKDVEHYLTDVYGENWETPRSDYTISERADKEDDPRMLLARPFVDGHYYRHIQSLESEDLSE